MCVYVRACVRAHTLRTVSKDKILHFINTLSLIVTIIITYSSSQPETARYEPALGQGRAVTAAARAERGEVMQCGWPLTRTQQHPG